MESPPLSPTIVDGRVLNNQVVNIQAAIESVKLLVASPQLPDEDPHIDAPETSVVYTANLDARFKDHGGFMVEAARKYVHEACQQEKLNEVLEEGYNFSAMLYTWRSCSLTIPTTRSSDQSNDLYETIVEVLEPEANKLRKFMDFQSRAITLFCNEIKRVCKDKQCYVSESYLDLLGKFINLFAVLDELKNTKASVHNDHSAYKRATDKLQTFRDTASLEESRKMSMFMATHNCILSELKKSLKGITGYEEFLVDIINSCVSSHENQQYLLPAEKSGLVKVIGFTLHLIDSDTYNINKTKKLNLHRIDKLFKAEEVVPLYGDMMVGPFQYILRTPNYDPEKWEKCLSDHESSQSELLKHIPALRLQHLQLVSELSTAGDNRRAMIAVMNKIGKRGSTPLQKCEDSVMYDLAVKSLHTLSSWTSRITSLFSWKLLHPANPADKTCPEDSVEYERATRYNYTPDELSAISEVIAMIKGVQEMVQKLESEFRDAACRYMFKVLQEFVQIQLREPLRKATKNKKEPIKSIIEAVRELSCQFARSYNKSEDLLLSKQKKDSQTGFKIDIPKTCARPSSTQLHLVRTMLESLVDKGNKVAGRKSPRKDLETSAITAIETFLKTSAVWPYLMNFNNSLARCCDLSQFWYREFYLEMTRGQRIQFPIEMSMPWILTSHILQKHNHSQIQYVLYPLDLYNDSADYAINTFKQAYLYEEIEAEVNLVFDQFVYKLAELVFQHYKSTAASVMLDGTFRGFCKKHHWTIPYPPAAKYDSLLQQRHLTLLGRQIDLNNIMSQRINELLLNAIRVAIIRFECGDLTGLVELEGLIKCNRLTHRLLSRYLKLDGFDEIFREANNSVVSPMGRITLYIFLEINFDFLPQFCYNAATNRFVRTVYPFVDKLGREKLPPTSLYNLWGSDELNRCYTAIYSMYSEFIGPPHFSALCSMMGYHEIAIITEQLLGMIRSLIVGLIPYLDTLKKVMPSRCNLPRYEYTSPGVLEFFQAKLQDIASYSDLQPRVYQTFREIGNAILFCLLIEQSLSQKEISEMNQATMFQHIIPKPYIPKGEKGEEGRKKREEQLKQEMQKLDHKYRHQHLSSMVEKIGNQQQKDYCNNSLLMAREKLCCGLSMFCQALKKLKSYVDNPEHVDVWHGEKAAKSTKLEENNVYDVMSNVEFHRLWSALQFVFCIPPRSANQFTVEALFGEGLHWAGCALVAVLGQQHRFQLMDYSYHLLRVHKVDQKDQDCKGVPLRKMVDRIRKFQILNDQIFGILEKYMVTKADRQSLASDKVTVEYFDPPKTDLPTVSLEMSGSGTDDNKQIGKRPEFNSMYSEVGMRQSFA